MVQQRILMTHTDVYKGTLKRGIAERAIAKGVVVRDEMLSPVLLLERTLIGVLPLGAGRLQSFCFSNV